MDIETIKKYLELRKYPSAILDYDLKVVWTNAEGIFSEFCLGKADLPNPCGIHSVNINGGAISALFTPLDCPDGTQGYVCELYTAEQTAQIGLSSEYSSKASRFFRVIKTYINHIINVGTYLENILADKAEKNPGKINQLLKYQQDSACKMLLQIINAGSVFETGRFFETPEVCTGLETVKQAVDETNLIISEINRKINLTQSPGAEIFEIAVPPKKFTIIFMNLLQNALLYSPPESDVDINIDIRKGKGNKECVIRIENLKTAFGKTETVYERSGLGLDISSFIASRYKGKAVLDLNDDERAFAEIVLPATQLKLNTVLKSNFKVYKSERFGLVRLFADEVLPDNTDY